MKPRAVATPIDAALSGSTSRKNASQVQLASAPSRGARPRRGRAMPCAPVGRGDPVADVDRPVGVESAQVAPADDLVGGRVDDGEQARGAGTPAPAGVAHERSRSWSGWSTATANRRRSSGSCQMLGRAVDVGVVATGAAARRRRRSPAIPGRSITATHQVSPIVARIVASNSASPSAARVAKIISASAPTGTRSGVSGCSIASAIAPADELGSGSAALVERGVGARPLVPQLLVHRRTGVVVAVLHPRRDEAGLDDHDADPEVRELVVERLGHALERVLRRRVRTLERRRDAALHARHVDDHAGGAARRASRGRRPGSCGARRTGSSRRPCRNWSTG